MSYQVLARKWRPGVFKDLVGQTAVVRILINALKNKRLHPSLIFAGPRGTGKTSTARILAKSLSCSQATDLTPCNHCKTCQDIDNSRSLDVMEIDGASNNGVEAVRQLKETITYLPSGPYKIYIIDEVHMLSVSAFNALLKTLEEPPPHALFVMATTEMRKIPSTVLSRCQILQFHQIADHLIYEQLKKICQQEKAYAEDSALWMLVRESQGSLRDAQGLLDQMITFCQKKFNSQDVSEILGLTDRSLLMQSLQSLLKRNPAQMLKVLSQLQVKGGDPALFLQHLIKEIRNLLLLKLPTSDSIKNLIPLSQQEKTKLLNWIEFISSEDLHLLFDMSLKGSWEINRVQDTKIFLEMLLLKMSQAPYIESLFGGTLTQSMEEEKQIPGKKENIIEIPSKKKQATEQTGINKIKNTLKENTGHTHHERPVDKDINDSKEQNHQKEQKTPSFFKQIRNQINSKKDSVKPQNPLKPQMPEKQNQGQKQKHTDIQQHSFIQQIQNIFEADILDSKDL